MFNESKTALEKLVLGKSITTLVDNAFADCTGLKEVTIGNSLTSLGSNAFAGCTSIKSLKIDSNVAANIATFNDSKTTVEKLVLGNSVTTLGADAFMGCTGLKLAILGSSINDIGDNAFKGCRNIIDLVALRERPVFINANVFEGVPKASCDLHVVKGALPRYKAQDVWKDFLYIDDNAEDYVDPEDPPVVTEPCDVNGDGQVTATDIACIINVLAGLEPASTYDGRTDVNGDGETTATDISMIVNHLAGL